MENEEPPSVSRTLDEDTRVSVPLGGPIFVPDLVSPLIRVPEFESAVFHELESLKAELYSETTDDEFDLSVEELKVFTDEELVAAAMKEAFEENGNSSQLSEDFGSSRKEDDQRMLNAKLESSGVGNVSASCDSSKGSSSKSSDISDSNNSNSKMRKRKRKSTADSKKSNAGKLVVCVKNKATDESYLSKIEHLARIREKQEEDKAAAKLHSLNASWEKNKSSENAETLKCLESLSCPVKVKLPNVDQHVPIRYPEVVLCVEVYHNKLTWKKTQEFLVLGQQSLTELRDKIHCLTDTIMRRAGHYDPSGYILIEDVICNDMRDPSAIDYSESILDWVRNSKGDALAKWECIVSGVGKKTRKALLGDIPISRLPQFRTAEMQKTRFSDLRFRVGAGYLYCHQGDCKHVVVIRDMRLIHPEDVQNRVAYPLQMYRTKVVLKKCSVCGIYKATKVTLDDKWAGENPCYFCDNCYYCLHYGEDGSLLYDEFTVYDFIQEY